MTRLTRLAPTLVPLIARLDAPPPASEVERDRRRDAGQPWRAWYKTARWQKLKRRIHLRDGFVCRRTGVTCTGRYPAPDSPVADHRVPHRGDAALFWDPDNIETVTKAYHDAEKQRLERRDAGRGWVESP